MVRVHFTTAAALTLVMLGGAAHADQLITYTGTIRSGNLAPFAGVHIGDTYTESFVIKTGAVSHTGPNPIMSLFGSSPGVTPNDVTGVIQFSGKTIVFNAAQGGSASIQAANYWPSYSHAEFVLNQTSGGVGGGLTNVASDGGVFGLAYSGTGPLTSSQFLIAGPGFTDFSLWKYTDEHFSAQNANGDIGKFFVHFTNISTRDLSLPTPEPGQYAAFAIGMFGLAALAIRKRKSSAAS